MASAPPGSEPLTTAALGVIAYLIGGSITVAQLRRTGRMILGSTLGESLGAALVVFLAMLLVLPEHLAGVPAVMLALAFGAIAAPTAPAWSPWDAVSAPGGRPTGTGSRT